jgi:hypothetical protein
MGQLPQTQTTDELFLFAILLGCKPKGRNVEQHDVMFAVARSLNELTDSIKDFWYSAMIHEINVKVKKLVPGIDTARLSEELKNSFSRRDKVHIDAWTKVEFVDGYRIRILKKTDGRAPSNVKLFFLNLGGYKEDEFEEFHKKLFVVAGATSEAINKVMNVSFMKEYSPDELGIAGSAHLDDKYKLDFEADDVICVSDALDGDYTIELVSTENASPNEMSVGYIKLTYADD